MTESQAEETPATASESVAADPGYAGVRNFLLYSLSVPERALRSTAGAVGGALRESCALLVPQAFQNSKTYTVMIRQMLDFLCEDVGGVAKREDANGSDKVENFVARKAVGNFIEMAGLATFHLSPLTLLAVVSDVAYGSQTFLRELSVELKKEGVIDQDTTIDHVDDLLNAIAGASRVTATAFDTPPLSVDGLRKTIEETKEAVRAIDPTKVIPLEEANRLWTEIHEIAAAQGVGIMEISSAMTLHTLDKLGVASRGAMSSVSVAGRLFNRHVVDHYRTALSDIRTRGIYVTVAETSGPYIESVWRNFSTDKPTVTEDLVTGKLFGQAYGAVRRWMGKC